MAIAFRELGMEVNIQLLTPRFQWRAKFPHSGEWNGIKYRYRSVKNIQNQVLKKVHRLALIAMEIVSSYFRASKAEIHYFYTPRFSDLLLPLLACSARGSKVIVDQTEMFSTLAEWPHKKEEKLIKRYADHILCLSSYTKEQFQIYTGKAEVHRSAIVVDHERFDKVNIVPEPFTLGYLGSFDKKDNVEGIIKAFVKAKEQLPQLKLKLIGQDPSNSTLSTIQDLGLAEQVELTGALTETEVVRQLKTCNTLIINRVEDEFSAHGYPIKLGEYFAAKRLVMISDIKGFAEDFEHGDLLLKYKANDKNALADAILDRYRNKYDVDVMVGKAYEYAIQDFGPKKLKELLRSILK